MRTNSQIRLNLFYIFFYTGCIFALYKSVSWIPAVEGDGGMFPQAVHLAQGKSLYSDVYEQYGSLAPIIQFPFLKIFGYKIIVIRYVGFIIILLISLMTYLIISEISSKKIAILSSLLIISTQPSWNIFNNKTWPIENLVWFNSYGLLFYLICFYFLIKINKTVINSVNNTYAVMAAVSSYFGSNARLDFIFPHILFLLFIIFFSNYNKKLKKIYIFTTALLYVMQFTYLLRNKTLYIYLEQIVMPLLNGDNSAVFSAPLSFYLKTIFTQIIASVIVFLLLFATFRTISKQNSQIIFLVTIIFFVTFLSRDLIHMFGLPRKIDSFFYLVTSDFMLSYITLLIVTSILISLKFISQINFNSKNLSYDNIQILYYLFPLTLLPSLHNLSLFYQYMILSPFLVSIIYFFEVNFKSNTVLYLKIMKLFSSFTTSLLVCSTVIFLLANSQTIYEYQYPTLKGMVDSNPKNLKIIESQFNEIDLYVQDNNLSIECGAALFSVTKQGYISNSRYPSLVISKEQNKLKNNFNNKNTIYYRCGISETELHFFKNDKEINILTEIPYFENTFSIIYTKLNSKQDLQ